MRRFPRSKRHHATPPATAHARQALIADAACEALEPRRMLTAVTAVAPYNGQASVPVGASVTVNFDTPLSPATVSAGTFQLRDPANNVVPASIAYNAATDSVTLTPSAPLNLTNAYYSATVSGGAGGVADAGGNALPANLTWSFTTGRPTFKETTVYGNLGGPTDIEFAPGGRTFVATRTGQLVTYSSLTDQNAVMTADFSSVAATNGDRGLLGLAIDPQYPSRPYLYVLYTYAIPLGATQPAPAGDLVSTRLSRITVDSSGVMVPGSEKVLVNDWPQQFNSHSAGTLKFGPDGYLYATGGDGANYNAVDYGQFGNPFNEPANQGGALRTQSVRSSNPNTELNGSVIRIDPNTGAAAPGNPIASGNANAQRIVAYGLRNPFRFSFRPGTSEIWIGDVGWNDYEEIDRLTSATTPVPALTPPVTNFGWPAYEGNNPQPGYQAANLPLLNSLYANPNATTKPYYAYSHADQVVPGSGETTGGSAITGISFYDHGAYPAAYNGALFFADYARREIYVMFQGPNGQPDPSTRAIFRSTTGGPVQLVTGPNGDLFYTDLAGGRIVEISSIPTVDHTPVAVATADKTSGGGPLPSTSPPRGPPT